MQLRKLMFLLGALGSAGIGMAGLAAESGAALSAKDAWIRWLPGSAPAGGYVTLVNSGDRPVSLVGASSADYGAVSLHRTRSHAGMSEMLAVDKIVIPAHSSVAFATEGYHLMLEQPKRALGPGDRAAITLRFSDGPPLTVQFALRKPDAGAAMPSMPGMAH